VITDLGKLLKKAYLRKVLRFLAGTGQGVHFFFIPINFVTVSLFVDLFFDILEE
jgi:hypothetical protein